MSILVSHVHVNIEIHLREHEGQLDWLGSVAFNLKGMQKYRCEVTKLNADSNSWIGTERRRASDFPLEYSPAVVHGR